MPIRLKNGWGTKMPELQTGLIEFHGKELMTAKDMESDNIYTAMKPIVENMGLSWGRQSDKIKSDSRYSHMYTPFVTNGGTHEMLSLPTDQLMGFLYSINPNKVRKDLRDTIIAYQQETFNAINDYWNKGYAVRESANMSPELIAFNSQATRQIDGLHKHIGTLKEEIGSIKDQFVHDSKERADIHVMLSQNTLATNRMNFALENMAMDTHQLAHIRKIVDFRGKALSNATGVALSTSVPTIYREINAKFNVRTYTEIKREHYEACLDYIETVTL